MERKPKKKKLIKPQHSKVLAPTSFTHSASSGFRLVNKHEAANIVGVSSETLKKYRLQENSTLVAGIHYHIWNSRTIRYNAELLADWALNRNHPEVHQRTIEIYLASLQSHQKKARRGSLSITRSS